jgi:NNP family nitrate/nitrite transporter-like MFS transporter
MARFQSVKGKALVFLLFIWILWFLNFVARTILAPLLPLIEDEFLVAHARATSIFLFLGLGYGLSVCFSGFYAKTLGLRRSVCACLLALGATFLVMSQIHIFELFYATGLVLGLGVGMYLPAIIPLLTEYYDQAHWGKVIAIHDSAASLGCFATPFVAVLALRLLPWRGTFVLVAGACLLCAVIFWFVSVEVGTRKETTYFPREVLRQRGFWIFGITWIFMAGATMGLYFVVPLYLSKELGLGVERANTIFGISRIGGACVGIVSGFLVDRFRAKGMVFFLVLITGILTALVAVNDLLWVQVVLFVQATIAAGYFPVTLVAISRMFERQSRGQAVGFIVTLGVVGTAIIPYLLGVSGDLVSFRLGFLLLGILTTLSSGLFWFMKEGN